MNASLCFHFILFRLWFIHPKSLFVIPYHHINFIIGHCMHYILHLYSWEWIGRQHAFVVELKWCRASDAKSAMPNFERARSGSRFNVSARRSAPKLASWSKLPPVPRKSFTYAQMLDDWFYGDLHTGFNVTAVTQLIHHTRSVRQQGHRCGS